MWACTAIEIAELPGHDGSWRLFTTLGRRDYPKRRTSLPSEGVIRIVEHLAATRRYTLRTLPAAMAASCRALAAL